MKFYTFVDESGEHVAVGADDGLLLDLRPLGGDLFHDMQSLIEGGEAALDHVRTLLANARGDHIRALADVRLAPPLPRPRKIRGFSVFEEHLVKATDGAARRMAAGTPDPEASYRESRKAFNLDSLVGPGWFATPAYYYSDCTAVTATDTVVQWPPYSQWLDYELELVAITGKPGRDIKHEDAPSHIFGYSIFNDLSARDAQFQAMATGLGFAKGKDFDGSNPFGPCIVTADELPDPYAATLTVRVNDALWSCSKAEKAQWTFADCIAYASQSQMIFPGELFSTGCTPKGCSMELMREFKRGDTVELEVEGIGILRTTIA